MAGWDAVTSVISKGWDAAFQSFMRGFGSPIAAWFTTSFPHAMSLAWNAAWSALATPVIKAFQSVQHAITTGFDQWWASHGHEIMQTWDAVTNDLVTGSKAAFDQIAQWARVMYEAVTGFIGDIVTGSKQDWAQIAQWAKVSFDAISGAWKSFTGGLESDWRTLVSWFAGPGDLHKVLVAAWQGLTGAVQVGRRHHRGHVQGGLGRSSRRAPRSPGT